MEHDRYCNDHALNQTVSRVLLIGLVLALSLMGIGSVLGFLNAGALAPQTVSFADLPAGLVQGAPMAFMSLGLIVLLATPAARVLVLLLGYVRRQQWLFAAIALMVLSVLVISVVIGLSK